MTRRMLWVLIIVACLLAGLFLNGYLTQRYGREHKALVDFVCLAQFLGTYAADHGDTLPESWASLVADGFVSDDGELGAQYLRYYEGNRVYNPDWLRWIPQANLTEYIVTDDAVINKATSQPARIIWLEGQDPSSYNELRYTRMMFDIWRRAREDRSPTDNGDEPEKVEPVDTVHVE